jgi:hypothetical protein
MPNNFLEHKQRWLQIANGEFEYSILFIKAWLPFNAWYCNSYPEKENKDRPILHLVKTTNNFFKTRIIALLEGDNEDSTTFRLNLVKLHSQLEICKVPTVQDCISFKQINYRTNPETIFTKNYRSHTFKIETLIPTDPHYYKIKVDVVNNIDANILPYKHNKYSIEHLKTNTDFKNLSEQKQNIVIEGFESLKPNKKESLIVSKKADSLSTIKEVLFTKNTDLLAQSIIEVLYNIRCILFHGEIQPNKDNLKIYEPAFYMLRLLIKSLE